ncbi:MAG TPA: phosphatase PAP2 family protein [Actinomycetota bacterium]|nr:phosphatase PAP2 family protein [Actinomycetota bacterium]
MPTLQRTNREALLAGAAFALAALTAGGRGRALDDRLFAWFNGGVHTPALDRAFKAVTELGSIWASATAAAVLAARGKRRQAGDAMAAAAAMWLAGQGLKRMFRRLRPYETGEPNRLLIGKPRGASWPSSHPAVLLTFVLVAGRDLGVTRSQRGSLAALSGVVGASRVYLGVHYPSDVAGGLLIARALAGVWSRTVSPRVLD